jgi:hypothetical protein
MAEDKEWVYGWVLLPVAVVKGFEKHIDTFAFENANTYFEPMGGVSWAWSEAATLSEAVETLEPRFD